MRESIAAYILFPLLSQYYCSHIINLFVISIHYDAISHLISSSFYSILSVSSVVVKFIALHHTDAHKPVLILVICVTYLVSISHTMLFHITCVYTLPEWDSSLLYPLTVSQESAPIEGSPHVYKTRLPASSQIVKLSNLPCVRPPLLLLPPRLPPLAHTLPSAHTYAVLYDSVVPKLPTLIDIAVLGLVTITFAECTGFVMYEYLQVVRCGCRAEISSFACLNEW